MCSLRRVTVIVAEFVVEAGEACTFAQRGDELGSGEVTDFVCITGVLTGARHGGGHKANLLVCVILAGKICAYRDWEGHLLLLTWIL